jgi:hypothetical protein
MRPRIAGALLAIACAVVGAWYLHDPPWVGDVTAGIREWRADDDGTRFRWTNGHGTFYVPSGVRELTLPMHISGPDGDPVRVRVSTDDRWLADVDVRPGAPWAQPTFPLTGRSTRRFRRIDVRVSRVSGFEMHGVQLGEPRLR